MNAHQYSAYIAVIVGFLFFVGTSVSGSFISGQADEPDNPLSSCNDIGGWTVVGDVVSCVSDSLNGYLDYFGLKIDNPTMQTIIFTPLLIGFGIIILKIIRGTS